MVRPGAKTRLTRTWATLLLCMVFMLLRFFMLFSIKTLPRRPIGKASAWRFGVRAPQADG
ncbi:MAG: hypothetical protein DLM66_15205 [Candidatus Dormiibacter spiritus]|nr:MAG: hypothetical protein DLM66_15205 [Candidatus Dormibacteraeota bacterium]